MDRIVIIGAGQGVLQAAISLRLEGFGASIMLIGAEEHLPYQRPPIPGLHHALNLRTLTVVQTLREALKNPCRFVRNVRTFLEKASGYGNDYPSG